jgi:chitinase
MADALKEGYNVIAMSFADQFKMDGTFQIDTNMCSGPTAPPDTGPGIGPWTDFVDPNTGLKGVHTHQCMPSKKNVSEAAGISMDSWKYVLSFGGAAGPGPRMDEAGDESQEDTFAEGFVNTYLAYKKGYGFDGIDIDVESSINSPVLRTFRKIYQKLHEKGELISMAPETPSLDPGEYPIFQAGATNSYAPLVDTTIIDSVSWVAPQLYNDAVPYEGDPVAYVKSLQTSSKLDWDGKELEIVIPPSKIVLGYPATQAAAPIHALPEWETPEGLLALYRSSPELMATRGVMTWSVGHDHSNGWKWIRAARQIWA